MTIGLSFAGAGEFIGMNWFKAKTFAEHMIGFSHDAVHVVAGVCLQLLIAALLKTSARSIWPWATVLALELVNEWSDMRVEAWPDQPMQWGEGAKDVLLTMGLPTLILALARFSPHLLGASAPAPSEESEK